MKKIILVSLILLLFCCNAIADDNYIINGDTVYIDDSKVYLSATPHTLSSSGWVYFNLTSKVYTGNIDACWGFNTSASKPKKADVYSPHWINTTTNHEKTFYNPSFITYTGNDLDYGNSYNTNYKYTITESIVNENGTTYITSNAAFDFFNTNGTNYTVYWYTRHDNHYLWEDFSSTFNSIIYNYEGFNKWYYIKNIPITSNKEYTVRAWIDVPVSTEKQSGKYYFAIKPSGETISQAVNNGHFYNLDPWWNATWSTRKEIILTGNTSGAQTDYQILLNVTYESEMQSNFDDLRFCNETHELDAWLESKVDSSYALIWVEFPTTPANGETQNYWMYYGNAGAASDWDGDTTFVFYDDFEDLNEATLIGQGGWLENGSNSNHLVSTTFAKESGGKSYRSEYISGYSGAYHAIAGQTVSFAIDYDGLLDSAVGASAGQGLSANDNPTVNVHDGISTFIKRNAVNDGNEIIYYSDAGFELLQAISQDTWYKISSLVNVATQNIKISIDDAAPVYDGDMRGSVSDFQYIKLNWYALDAVVYIDRIRVRNYVANPATYAFGAEESAGNPMWYYNLLRRRNS